MAEGVLELREEEKFFTKKDLFEGIGVSENKLNLWIEKGKLPKPSSSKGYSREEVETILQISGVGYSVPLQGEAKRNWNELLNSELILENGGIFVLAPSACKSSGNLKEMIKQYGVWNAQGFNNHEHLADYTSNPIHQMLLAKELIENLKEKVCKLGIGEKVIIYWNGSKDSTVCIYLNLSVNDNFLKEYDRQLKMEKMRVLEMNC